MFSNVCFLPLDYLLYVSDNIRYFYVSAPVLTLTNYHIYMETSELGLAEYCD